MNLVNLIKYLLISLLIFSISLTTKAQNADSSLNELSFYRHQLSIGLSNLIIISTSNSEYDVSYFYMPTNKSRLRSHFKYNEVTGDDGKLEYGIKIGYDRRIKNFEKWLFYFGIDTETSLAYYNIDNRNKRIFGLNPFIGVQFNISNHFSLSTEPTFTIKHIIDSDPEHFTTTQVKWNEYRFDNIGLINVNFHF